MRDALCSTMYPPFAARSRYITYFHLRYVVSYAFPTVTTVPERCVLAGESARLNEEGIVLLLSGLCSVKSYT